MITPNIFDNSSSLHIAAADYFLKVYNSSITQQDAFHVALSGGTTPKHLFQLLAKPPYIDKIDWSKVSIYFGDERFVAHSHDDSNFKMASQALLNHVNLPKDNIHPVATNMENATVAADNYNQLLAENLPSSRFDLILLGLGPDGHTASLFPGTGILTETKKLCDAVYVEKFDSWRTSITFPVINQAKHILLLSEGKGKIDIIQELVNAKPDEVKYPIQMIQAENEMRWYIDKAAASGIR